MNALILDPIAKLIISLLIALGVFLGIKHYNGLNQKVGRLETQLTEKQQLIDTQNTTIAHIQKQITSQAQAIADLQKAQDELQANSEQRKITIKEILTHDQDAKTWASQPVPDAIRSLFNNARSTDVVNTALSSPHPVQ
jgi:LysB family phage lysis regulatory protein